MTSFINDDLPQPDGPTTAANSPRRTFSDVPFNARTPPDAPRYVSVTSPISTDALMPGLSSTSVTIEERRADHSFRSATGGRYWLVKTSSAFGRALKS